MAPVRLWQLLDSALPTGFFAHSQGLEAWHQAGGLREAGTIERFARSALAQVREQQLPLARVAHASRQSWLAADRDCESWLTNAVANRASRAQGQALLRIAAVAFDLPDLDADRRAGRHGPDGPQGHLAPAFGRVAGRLAIPLDQMAAALLYTALRDLLSAAVRLGCLGPEAAQRLQARLAPLIDDQCLPHAPWPGCQIHPLADLIQAGHDRLYSRLFSS